MGNKNCYYFVPESGIDFKNIESEGSLKLKPERSEDEIKDLKAKGFSDIEIRLSINAE